MRKIALLTVPLVILGLVSLHAEEMDAGPMVADSPKVELKGNSTLTFGIDLDTNATGFSNTMETDLKVTLIPKATSDSGMDGMGNIYGWIELKDYKWEVTSADGSGATTAPSITTKLFVGPFSITTYNKPTIEVDYVDPKDDDDGDATDVDTTYEGSGGLSLGYELDPIDLSIGILSENDWKDDDPSAPDHADCHVHDPDTNKISDCAKPANADDRNTANAYAFLGTIGVDVGDSANVKMAVAYGHEYEDRPIGIGAKATFDLNDTIHPHVAFDGKIPAEGTASIPWDVGSGLKWDLSDDDKSYFETNLMMYIPPDGSDSTLGISATLKEGDEDEGGLESLGATLTVSLNDLTSQTNETTWATEVAAHYKVSGIKPFFDVEFSNAKEAKTAFKAGLELSMVENVVTTIQYESTDILGGNDRGDVTAALKISY